MMAAFDPAEYPYLVDFAVKHIVKAGYDFGAEFEYGLTRVLDALG